MRMVVLDGHVLNPGDNPWTELEQLGQLTVHARTPEALVVERCRDAVAIFTNKTPVTAAAMRQLPALRYIGVLATGVNVVDVAAAQVLGIPVCNVVAYGPDAVAEHVFALLLELTRDVGGHARAVRAGAWCAAPDWCFWNQPLLGLNGLTLGILGFGAIGQRVAGIARAFGMRVLVSSRTRPAALPSDATLVSREELFAQADVLTLHCPLTDETAEIINAQSLARMKRGALLINTARGGLVNESDVANALLGGHLGGYGADTLSGEPPAGDNPLLAAPRVYITPHIAWATLAARRNITRLTAQNLRAWLDGAPINVVNAPLAPR